MKAIDIDTFLSGDLEPGEYDVTYKGFYFKVVVGDRVDENTAINFDGYGSGTSRDGKYIDNYLKEHSQNCIDIRYQYGHDSYGNSYDGYKYSKWDKVAAEFMEKIIETKNLNPNNSLLMGFSSTAAKTIGLASKYAVNNNTDGGSVLIIEAVPGDDISRSDVETLIDHNTLVINAHANNDYSLMHGRSNTCEGLHMLDISFNITKNGRGLDWGTKHILVHRILAEYGITDLSSGNFDFSQLPSTFEYEGNVYDISYDILERYYDENGKYISNPLTFDQANDLINTNITPNVLPEDVIQSDNEYLSKGLSIINSMIRQSSLEGVNAEGGYSSTTAVPSSEPIILFKMLSSCKMLLEKLGEEIVTIGAIGDKFASMDNILADEAQILGMEISSELLPEVELINYKSRDMSNLIPESLTRELEELKKQIDNNSEYNPFVEPGGEKDSKETEKSSDKNKPSPSKQSNPVVSNPPANDPVVSDPTPSPTPSPQPEPTPAEQDEPTPTNPDTPAEPVKPTPTSTTQTTKQESDDSVRELVEQDLEEILPKVSKKKEKTPIIPSKVIPEKKEEPVIPVEPEPVVPVEPEPTPPPEPVVPVEPEPVIPVEPEPVVPTEPEPTPAPEPEPFQKSVFRTIGIAAGIGAGIGAVAYGVNNQINKRELKDGYDYSYEDKTSNDEYEVEIDKEEYNPYSNYKKYGFDDIEEEKEGDE